jgi:hypothetical protein
LLQLHDDSGVRYWGQAGKFGNWRFITSLRIITAWTSEIKSIARMNFDLVLRALQVPHPSYFFILLISSLREELGSHHYCFD